jgi:hypothetical protein
MREGGSAVHVTITYHARNGGAATGSTTTGAVSGLIMRAFTGDNGRPHLQDREIPALLKMTLV